MIHMIDVPAKQIPPFRYQIARDSKIKQVMLTTHGGLGDQVCAEPTLRYAFKLFEGYEISLLTAFPELFTHLPFKNVFQSKSPEAKALIEDEWLVLHTYHPENHMNQDFLSHTYTHCVDFSSISAFQRQLPIADRHVKLPSVIVPALVATDRRRIVIHPGRHWPSKTFPKAWWDEVIKRLCQSYSGVAIIGKDISEDAGTVDVEIPDNCTDLRNKLSTNELLQVLREADAVITNDSAPLHIAAAGNAFIFFIATCKEPDYLLHWRHGRFGWRMRNLGTDGLWNHQNSCPVREESLFIDKMPPGLLERCLPTSAVVLREVARALTEY